MDILQTLRDFGWIGVLLIFLIQVVWPQAFNLFKNRAELGMEEMKMEMELQREESKTEREERAAERQFRHVLDERQVKAYEKLVETAQVQAQLLVSLNERLNQIDAKQQALNMFIVDAVAQMRERVSSMHPPKTKKDE